ncbi:MAG TPA: 6-phosphogluconolactonase [Allosphingosinicella sp.]|jgi:6-phosphogluconolactonase
MDEIEWWEFESEKDLAEQAAGDIGFVIERAIEAHGGARVALPGEDAPEAIFSALLQNRAIDWSRVTLIPTDDRLVPLDDQKSAYRRLDGMFGAVGAEIVSLVDESALQDVREAGRLADARLSLLQWPLDLACLGVGVDGHTAGMLAGPDLDAAVAGPRERRAVGVRHESGEPRITLTAPVISSARAVMLVLKGSETRHALEQAIKEGPLSSKPVGRVLSAIEAPIDIFWSAD